MAVIYSDIHKPLVEKSKQGEYKAQQKLYKLYAKAMFNICYRMMNNFEEAEDMLQDSFTYAFQKLDSFRYESSFGAWLKRIVVNRCINELKRKKTELILTPDFKGLDKLDADDLSDNQYEIAVTVQKVHKAIALLPDGYRVVLSLYLLEGYDHTEISDILGISESTSKSQFLRARKKLIEIMKTFTN